MLRIIVALASVPPGLAVDAEPPAGVIVEEVAAGFAAAEAGLQPGDLLLRWKRLADQHFKPQPSNGAIVHPFDLWVLETEEAAQGAVVLFGSRGDETFSSTLSSREWRLTARPRLEPQDLEVYTEGKELAASRQAEGVLKALDLWRPLAEAWEGEGSAEASWLLFEMGRLEHLGKTNDGGEESFERAVASVKNKGRVSWLAELYRRRGRMLRARSRWERMEELYRAALLVQEDGLGGAATLSELGFVAWRRGDLKAAEDYAERCLAIRERLAPESLVLAQSFNSLGVLANNRGDLVLAEAHHERSLGLREKLAPATPEVAASLNNLAVVALRRGDLAAARGYFERSLDIRRGLAPNSLDVAQSLNNLGAVYEERGDLAIAERHYRESLGIREKLLPNSLAVAASLNNLGMIAQQRGDLPTAEVHLRRSLAIKEAQAPESLLVAASLGNLGLVALDRGDSAAAEAYHRQSLAIHEKMAPDSLAVATDLHNLARVAMWNGALQVAEQQLARCLAIRERLAPASLDLATTLHNMGLVAARRGDLGEAESYFQRALAIQEKLAPDGLELAWTLFSLGVSARDSGGISRAQDLLDRSLSISSSLAPGTGLEAQTLREIGKVQAALRRPAEALDYFLRAITAVESQAMKLGGGTDSRTLFLSRYGDYYKSAIERSLEQGQIAAAFELLERSRARSFLAMLSERDLFFAAELPEDLHSERLQANTEHDRILNRLGSWNALRDDANEEKVALQRQLSSVLQRQREVQAKVRLASPRLAALEDPHTLELEQAQTVLDPGTVLLAYSLGEESSLLFVVGKRHEEFAVLPLGIGAEQTRRLVQRFREMWKPGGPRDEWVRHQAAELSDQLLSPAASWIGKAERLVILPDGPLYYLSFAALRSPDSSERFRYLVEARPVSVVASATLLAQLKEERKATREASVAAFADPQYPHTVSEEQAEEPVLRSVVRDGFEFPSLPGTRAEAAMLERLYPDTATVYVGAEASEEAAKSVGTAASILHFATHGLVDDRQPLSSALVLSIPEEWQAGRDNGLLQAWEIFEQVRLDADLVTLSACETALGKDGGGEGLLGLTRAFQYAGARTVLASLWAVSDASTAALMERFYRHLRSGKSKDQALRHAQLELLAGPIVVGEGEERREVDFSHPFFWAPFQIIGDWQ